MIHVPRSVWRCSCSNRGTRRRRRKKKKKKKENLVLRKEEITFKKINSTTLVRNPEEN
jgi:hypothetical protein